MSIIYKDSYKSIDLSYCSCFIISMKDNYLNILHAFHNAFRSKYVLILFFPKGYTKGYFL